MKSSLVAKLQQAISDAQKMDSCGVDVDVVRKPRKNFLGVGYHEDCVITSATVHNEEGELMVMPNDPTFVKLNLVVEKDGASKNVMYMLPTTKLGYGVNNTDMPFLNVSTFVRTVFPFGLDQEKIKILAGLIIADCEEILVGLQLHLEIGYKGKNHVLFESKGVYRINEFDPKLRQYELLDPCFPDSASAELYAKEKNIAITRFPEITRLDPSPNNVIKDDTAELLQAMGVDLGQGNIPAVNNVVAPKEAPVEQPKKPVKSLF